MKAVGDYIREHTRNTYNYSSYEPDPTPWLTTDDARRVAEIAREETLLEVAAWINDTFIFSKQAKEDFSQTFKFNKL